MSEKSQTLKSDFPDISGELKVTLFAINQREQRKAIIEMDKRDALLVLKKGKVK